MLRGTFTSCLFGEDPTFRCFTNFVNGLRGMLMSTALARHDVGEIVHEEY